MKIITKGILFIILFEATFELRAQNLSNDNQAIEMLKTFYTARSTVGYADQDQEKLDSLLNIYCTRKLIDEVNEILETSDINPDVITRNYGIDSLGIETLSIRKNPSETNVYTVSYSTISFHPSQGDISIKVEFQVTTKEENGILKIDNIE